MYVGNTDTVQVHVQVHKKVFLTLLCEAWQDLLMVTCQGSLVTGVRCVPGSPIFLPPWPAPF